MFRIDRRRALLGPLSASVAASWGERRTDAASAFVSTQISPASSSLTQVALRAGLFFGCAVRLADLKSEPDLRASVLQECSYLVPETDLKWAELESKRGELTFAAIDDLIEFATAHGKRVRGHTLLWHRSVPSWAEAALKEEGGWATIDRYFSSVIPRYGAVIDQWDVINEPISDEGGLTENVFLRNFGADYIPRALRTARKSAPHAKLMINEYGLEYDLLADNAKRSSLLELVRSLKREGAPLDGVGLQSHLDLAKGSVSKAQLVAFLDALTAMGVFFVVTELDVKEVAYTASSSERDRMVGDEVRRYLDIVLRHPGARGVMTWGLSDRHSWLKVGPDDFARYPTAWHDGSEPGPNRGLPLNAAMGRKPMYFAILDALTNAPRRSRLA